MFTLSSRQAAVRCDHGREFLGTSKPQGTFGVLDFRAHDFQPFESY